MPTSSQRNHRNTAHDQFYTEQRTQRHIEGHSRDSQSKHAGVTTLHESMHIPSRWPTLDSVGPTDRIDRPDTQCPARRTRRARHAPLTSIERHIRTVNGGGVVCACVKRHHHITSRTNECDGRTMHRKSRHTLTTNTPSDTHTMQ